MMTAILRFLGLPSPLVLAIYAAVGMGLFVAGGTAAWHYKTLEEEAATAKAATAVVAETHQQDAITETVSQQTAVKEAEVRVVTQTITKEVTKYVTKKADANCPVPRGAVSMHDAAARGVPVVPDAAGKSHGAPFAIDDPSGLLLSQLMTTVAVNYGRYNEMRERFTGLQGWVRQQQALSVRGGR